jgi:hypothetical protein
MVDVTPEGHDPTKLLPNTCSCHGNSWSTADFMLNNQSINT